MKEIQNRKGRIDLSNELYATASIETMKLLFSGFYPFYVEDSPIKPYVSYYGVSEHFDELEEGGVIPQYIAEIDLENNTIKYEKL